MKILYVTDLHGDKNKYRKSLDIAVEKNISIIVNGGDMLPKLGERHLEQPIFINEFLRGYFSELERNGITYLAMLGNDDLLSVEGLFDTVCGEYENVHNIAGKKIRVGGYEFIGMNHILDHPFGCKDRVVTETHYIPQRQPLLSLHGHIHESPDTQKGRWINQIRGTACIQTGQTELYDNDMVYAEIDLQSREYSRKVINVK